MGFAVGSRQLDEQRAGVPNTLPLFLHGRFCGSERGQGCLTQLFPLDNLNEAF